MGEFSTSFGRSMMSYSTAIFRKGAKGSEGRIGVRSSSHRLYLYYDMEGMANNKAKRLRYSTSKMGGKNDHS